jgi:hypothetical protein
MEGSLCLHFVNTVHSWLGEELRDCLLCPIDMVVWARKAGILTSALITSLELWAVSNPMRAEQGLKRAKKSAKRII